MSSFVGEKAYLNNKIIYGKVHIDGHELTIGDLVYFYRKKNTHITRSGNRSDKINCIGQVLYFYETRESKSKCVHLKELLPKTKVFRTKEDDEKRKKVKFGIELFDPLSVCQNLEVSNIDLERGTPTSHDYFYRDTSYDASCGRFENVAPVKINISEVASNGQNCHCHGIKEREEIKLCDPIEETELHKFWNCFQWKGIKWSIGDAVYLTPENDNSALVDDDDEEQQDQEMSRLYSWEMSHDYVRYPEFYRKVIQMKNTTKPSTKDPFDIGFIKRIWSSLDEKRVRITTLKLDRPNKVDAFEKDLNVVYLSNKVSWNLVRDLQGKCYVLPETVINENGQTAEQWTDEGEHRFYIGKMYDGKSNNNGTTNSSEAHEGSFVGNAAEDSVCTNVNLTRDCFVRISAEEKRISDDVLALNCFVRDKNSLNKKRKFYIAEMFQAEQSDDGPKKKIMKVLSKDDDEEDEDDFKISKKTTPNNSATKTKITMEEEKEILKWFTEKNRKLEVTCLPEIVNPLKVLDIFSGAGGFSHGLDAAKAFETKWAIEWDKSAARAFKQNIPNASVFRADCNVLMKKIKNADRKNKPAIYKNQALPKKGEVDMIVGGPPCQGFSRLNHFINGENSKKKRSMVYSFLEYCEYYIPKYIVFENVSSVTKYQECIDLISSLVNIGYQINFGILQAGHYGPPQSRRRFILLAARKDVTLPDLPDPVHVFDSSHLNIIMEDRAHAIKQEFKRKMNWIDSAPYRTLFVKDAFSDLPHEADLSATGKESLKSWQRAYDSAPQSHFQRKMRKMSTDLIDHLSQRPNPLNQARIEHIPIGGDWRDLPNISVELSDGRETVELVYTHNDTLKGKSRDGALRGVCVCATTQSKKNKKGESICSNELNQKDTLIPWFVVHNANKHQNMAGTFGRIEWDGFLQTATTTPEPNGKHGCVLHPEADRIISIRELARCQGFPDDFQFYGTMKAKHRQIGNAVAPPMAKAIGIEIRKAYGKSKK